MNIGRQTWVQVRAEWRTNPRLRLGASLVLAILALYAWLVLHDLRGAAEAVLEQESQRAAKMQRLKGQAEWLERAKQLEGRKVALEAELGRAQSIGLAQAKEQSWLGALLGPYGTSVQMQFASPTPIKEGGSLWRIPITLNGSLAPAQVLGLLQQLEARRPVSVIQNARMSLGEAGSFSLAFDVIYRVGSPAPGAWP